MSNLGPRDWLAVFILFFVNLLNYIDRYTVPAVLADTGVAGSGLQSWFSIGDAESGLIQTVFVCVYMVAAPVFGYLGDRYNRRIILAVGVAIWSTAVLGSSAAPQNMFWLFMLMRAIVGIGEASYATVGPTIITDLFTGEMRARMLMVFYFATPVGAGLGVLLGGVVASATKHWQYGLLVTPLCGGYLSVLLILFALKVPKRGEADLKDTTTQGVHNEGEELVTTSYLADLKQLMKNKSYIWVAWAQVCQAFVTGALSFWGPIFITRALTVTKCEMPSAGDCVLDSRESGRISIVLGMIIMASGIVGVAVGTMTAERWSKRNPRADPLVCGWGMIFAAPCLHLALHLPLAHIALAYVFMFLANFGLCTIWALVTNIVMSTTIPQRRSTANAIQILLLHLFGDAASPTIIGAISDTIADGSKRPIAAYQSLQDAMFIGEFLSAIGGFFFLVCSWYIVRDRKNVERFLKGFVDALGRPIIARGKKENATNGIHNDNEFVFDNGGAIGDEIVSPLPLPPPYSSAHDDALPEARFRPGAATTNDIESQGRISLKF